MYFINRGNVQVVLTQIDETTGAVTHAKLAQMGAGAYFGEIALLDRTHPIRTVSVVSITYCNFFILKYNDFEQVMLDFPEVAGALHKTVELRRQKSEATNTALKNNQHNGQVLTSGIEDIPKKSLKRTSRLIADVVAMRLAASRGAASNRGATPSWQEAEPPAVQDVGSLRNVGKLRKLSALPGPPHTKYLDADDAIENSHKNEGQDDGRSQCTKMVRGESTTAIRQKIRASQDRTIVKNPESSALDDKPALDLKCDDLESNKRVLDESTNALRQHVRVSQDIVVENPDSPDVDYRSGDLGKR